MIANKQPNVVLISLDGVRADVAYSGKFPTLNQLCERGVVFKRVVSSSPLTPVSHASVFTGLFPPRHGVRHLFLEQIVDDVKTLPEILKEHGYATHAIVSCPGLNHWYGFNRGFDSYDDRVPPGADGKDALHTVDVQARGRSAKKAGEVAEKAAALLNELPPERFFLFLHFFDAHWPYEPPPPFATLCNGNLYEGEIAYIDQMLGQFLEDISRRGLWDNLLLIVMADHGEDLNGLYSNDHGGEKLGHPEEDGHGCLLYDATQLVPLIIHFPWQCGYQGQVESQVRLVDIAPTVLDWLQIDDGSDFDGVSLMPHVLGKGKDLVGYCETHYPRENPQTLAKHPDLHDLKAVRLRKAEAEFKVIWHLESDWVEIYDLQQDPLERVNLVKRSPADG